MRKFVSIILFILALIHYSHTQASAGYIAINMAKSEYPPTSGATPQFLSIGFPVNNPTTVPKFSGSVDQVVYVRTTVPPDMPAAARLRIKNYTIADYGLSPTGIVCFRHTSVAITKGSSLLGLQFPDPPSGNINVNIGVDGAACGPTHGQYVSCDSGLETNYNLVGSNFSAFLCSNDECDLKELVIQINRVTGTTNCSASANTSDEIVMSHIVFEY